MCSLKQSWKKIPCRKTDLQLNLTLNGGQSFRWKKCENDVWIGVFKSRVWYLSQTDDHLLYQSYQSDDSYEPSNKMSKLDHTSKHNIDDDSEELLRQYFRLDTDLAEYYKTWSKADPYFEKFASVFYGIRILNQDFIENLFSFICSSNNNITRISSMVNKLCTMYGPVITTVDNITYHDFPDIDKLSSPNVESELRKAGFGYRVKFIQQSAVKIKSFGNQKWIDELKKMPYGDAKKELMKLPGIGSKVADCICLMSLSHLEAIPVDTHIFQVASKVYLPHLKSYKSVTDKVYNEISKYFQDLYGEKAGWAHTVRQVHYDIINLGSYAKYLQLFGFQTEFITIAGQ